MTDFKDLVSPDAVFAKAPLTSKKILFQKISEMSEQAYGLPADLVCERLQEREKLGSTGFGGGIAIPHAKVEGLDRVYGLVLCLENPIPFEAVDDSPVDIVFSLLSPVESGAEHLKTLARVSRYLRSGQNAARIRGTTSDAALLALLAEVQTGDAV